MLNICVIGEYFNKRLMRHTLNDSITDSVYTHSTESDLIKAATPFINYIDNIFKECTNDFLYIILLWGDLGGK